MGPIRVVLPVRLQSTRLPRKALVRLAGSSLLEHVWRRALRADVGEVVIATDSAEVETEACAFGAQVVRTGPAANGTLRCAAAIGSAQVILNVQADQPLLDPAHVRALAERMQTAELATVVTPYDGDPDDRARVKAVLQGDRAIDFHRGPQWSAPTGDRSVGAQWRHLGLYGFTRGMLEQVTRLPVSARAQAEGLEQLTWLDAGLMIRVVQVDRAEPAVDTPAQLASMQAFLHRS